jgi:hypothetical protein
MHTSGAIRAAGTQRRILPSLRANGSRECAPDDRLREAIHSFFAGHMDCFVAEPVIGPAERPDPLAPRNDGVVAV